MRYLLSFVYVGIYWNNHHHMFQVTETITGGVLWANLHLLFWLSLFPFSTAWMDESGLARVPVVVYGCNLLLAAVAYSILKSVIVAGQGQGSRLRRAVGRDLKGKASPVLYLAGIACALLANGETAVPIMFAVAFFIGVAVMWLIPDRRIERHLAAGEATSEG